MNTPPRTGPIRLLLVDDSEVVRAGLKTLLGLEPSLQVVAEAGTAKAAISAQQTARADVVILDIRLPDGSGLEVCRRLLAESADVHVLILTSILDQATIDDAIRAGASGYLLKEIDGRGLVNAIHTVAAGGSVLDPAVTARVLQLVRSQSGGPRDRLAVLSAQEKRVLALIAEGCTNREVGERLGLAERTVRNLLSTVFDKLHVSRRAEAAALFAQEQKP